MFRWAAEEELVPGAVHQDLRSVAGLREGKTDARETRKVGPVPREHVEAALRFLPAPVAAMVRLQLVSGCSPAEVCAVRPRDVDKADPSCWVYRPGSGEGPHGRHKTAHHGHDRLVLLGPVAQAVLAPFLGGDAGLPCFRPQEAERERNERRRRERRTPMTPSQRARRLSASPARPARDRYDTHSYRRAVSRACRRAGVPAWAPNRLRLLDELNWRLETALVSLYAHLADAIRTCLETIHPFADRLDLPEPVLRMAPEAIDKFPWAVLRTQ